MAEGSASTDNVTLFSMKFSTVAQMTRLALVEKGIPFTLVEVSYVNKPKELLEANPIYGKVPTMIHNGTSIVESRIILEYIEEAWTDKAPLMPKGALAKSKVRFWTDYIYNKGYANLDQLLRSKPGSPEHEAAKAEMPKFFKTVESSMVKYSAAGPFFTGVRFGYLDVILSPFACLVPLVEFLQQSPFLGPAELPRFHKWGKAMKAHISFKETHPSDEESLDFFVRVIHPYLQRLQATA